MYHLTCRWDKCHGSTNVSGTGIGGTNGSGAYDGGTKVAPPFKSLSNIFKSCCAVLLVKVVRFLIRMYFTATKFPMSLYVVYRKETPRSYNMYSQNLMFVAFY